MKSEIYFSQLAFALAIFTLSLNAQTDNFERLPVTITATVKWEEITKSSEGFNLMKISGSYSITIDGLLKFNSKNSPITSKGNMTVMPVEIYDSDLLTVTMDYEEEWIDIHDNRNCTDPLVKRYQGKTVQTIETGPSLTINNFSSAIRSSIQNLPPKEKEIYEKTSGMQSIIPDFYQFSVGGGNLMETSPREINVRGVRRKTDCSFEEVEKRFPGFNIGIQMEIPESGEMSGKETWNADCDGVFPPSFGLKVSNMTSHGMEKPFNPPRKSNGNATYSLEWKFGL
ncbi:hypothetical protein [Lentimicrobium sp.]|jgi:hypothetical protein|uniref:hypothetical protein n=1 Tax=Lentimicrobium sp. TaxID=2034841 RepID=UPI002B96B934|nr:hypothetical protein [Lentimicrobium sp.]HRW70542.1 hypothetical protein [Lentimicrobium sp.]